MPNTLTNNLTFIIIIYLLVSHYIQFSNNIKNNKYILTNSYMYIYFNMWVNCTKNYNYIVPTIYMHHRKHPMNMHTQDQQAPHHSVFLQAGCPSCRPTNSVKALKEPMNMHSEHISPEVFCILIKVF